MYINLVVIVMLAEVGPLMLNMIIQRLDLMQLCKTQRCYKIHPDN